MVSVGPFVCLLVTTVSPAKRRNRSRSRGRHEWAQAIELLLLLLLLLLIELCSGPVGTDLFNINHVLSNGKSRPFSVGVV